MSKKRANGEGSIRKKANGRWEGRYTVGVDPTTGKNVQRSVSAKSQAECKEKLRCAIAENRGLSINHDGDYTVAEWCRLWLKIYSRPNIRTSTADNYTNMMLHNCLQQAVTERILPYNPCDGCRIPKKEKKIIPPELVGAYLREAEAYGVYLELPSGLRRGELLALLWTDLDAESRMLTVNKQVTRQDGELEISEPKTQNSIRKVALPQQTMDLLIAEHATHPDSPLMFMSPKTGTYWSPESIARIHKKLLEAAGIDSAGFTLDTYTHITHQIQHGAAGKIGGFMAGVRAETPPPEPPEPKPTAAESGCKVIEFRQAM